MSDLFKQAIGALMFYNIPFYLYYSPIDDISYIHSQNRSAQTKLPLWELDCYNHGKNCGLFLNDKFNDVALTLDYIITAITNAEKET